MAAEVAQRTYHNNQFYGHAKTVAGDVHGDVQYNDHYHYSGHHDDTDRDVLEALFLTAPEVDREEIISAKGRRVPGTCDWIFGDAQFKSWLDGDLRALWINGGPGKGKTLLSVYLSQELEARAAHEFELLYFFCSHAGRHNAAIMLRSLLFQLLRSTSGLASELRTWFSTTERIAYALSNRDVLWVIFTKVLSSIGHKKRTSCLLDGIDELEPESMAWLVEKLRDFHDRGAEQPAFHKVQILVVSRSLPSLRGLPQIALDNDNDANTSRDIEMFVASRARQLAQRLELSDDISRTIRESLLTRSDGTFLWVGFAMHELDQIETRSELMTALAQLPIGLPAYYKRMLSQIKDRYRSQSAQILRWIALARRPMQVEELASALDVRVVGPLAAVDLMRDQIAVCGPIITFNEGIVGIVHHSAREFLLEVLPLDVDEGLTLFHIDRDQALLDITRRCVSVIQNSTVKHISALKKGRWPRTHRKRKSVETKSGDVLKDLPLLGYASRYWLEHARSLSTTAMETLLVLPFFRLENWATRHCWAEVYSDSLPEVNIGLDTPLLHTACASGVADWVKLLTQLKVDEVEGRANFDEDDEINAGRKVHLPLAEDETLDPSSSEEGPEKRAVGFEEPISDSEDGLIFDTRSGDPLLNYLNKKDDENNTPLSLAIGSGDEETVRFLLEKGASVDYESSYETPPLFSAVRRGQRSLIKLLLDHGADVNKDAGRYQSWTPMHAAVPVGDIEIMRILLDAGADLLIGYRDGTALAAAQRQDPSDMVALMVRYAVQALQHDQDPLHTVARHADYGHLDVVLGFAHSEANKRLPADAHFMAEDWRKFMCSENWTFDNRGSRVLQYFLARGCDVQFIDDNGGSLLHFHHHDSARINYLLDQGVPLEGRDQDGQTPLHRANYAPDTKMLDALLARGADVDARDVKGETALHMFRDVDKAKLLVEYHADLEAQDHMGRTPLHTAAENWSNDDMVAFLISRGANVHALDAQNRTPLHICRSERSIKALIKAGASIEARDVDGRVPIHLACCHSEDLNSEIAVRSFLHRGADVHSRDNAGRTSLHLAAAAERFSVLKLLLRHGVDVNVQDISGWTALHYVVKGLFGSYAFWEDRIYYHLELLLSNMADPRIADYLGDTVLHKFAALPLRWCKKWGFVSTIPEHDLDHEFVDSGVERWNVFQLEHDRGSTGTANVTGFEKGYKLIETLLVSHGVDKSVKNEKGFTAEDLKSQSIQMLSSLRLVRDRGSWSDDGACGLLVDQFWRSAPGSKDEIGRDGLYSRPSSADYSLPGQAVSSPEDSSSDHEGRSVEVETTEHRDGRMEITRVSVIVRPRRKTRHYRPSDVLRGLVTARSNASGSDGDDHQSDLSGQEHCVQPATRFGAYGREPQRYRQRQRETDLDGHHVLKQDTAETNGEEHSSKINTADESTPEHSLWDSGSDDEDGGVAIYDERKSV
ncbi:hypothetical protein AC579_1799 [Pseudocercospora musae]|uniref:Uncharacterized protein n=1 Tax=Pseudocercospora musae TaxID=113226 RepID=A0A139I742_9PEZI|nr:hypothetical protein AC579_1799 [Pseudocercospora musae]